MSYCQMSRGNVYLDWSREAKDQPARRRWVEQTEDSYRKAIEHAQPLVKEHPFNPDYQLQFIRSCYSLGLLYRGNERGKEAESLYEKVLLSYKVLALEYPKKYVPRLGIAYSNLGNCITANGRPEAALSLYVEGVSGLERALAEDRTDANLRKCLRDALRGWANALTILGRYEEALRHLDRALELEDERGPNEVRLQRATTLAHSGDHRRAVAEAEAVTEKKPSFEILYSKACVYAVAVRAARQDARLNREERERLVDQYASLAVALLHEADRAGFFTKDRRKRAQSDKDLDPIRDREDFKRLLAGEN